MVQLFVCVLYCTYDCTSVNYGVVSRNARGNPGRALNMQGLSLKGGVVCDFELCSPLADSWPLRTAGVPHHCRRAQELAPGWLRFGRRASQVSKRNDRRPGSHPDPRVPHLD